MELHEKIHHLFFVVLRRPFILVGHDFYRMKEFKAYNLTYMAYGLTCLFLISAVNTVMKYDMVTVLHMVSFTGMATQVHQIIFHYECVIILLI